MPELWIAIGILLFAIVFFITEWLRLDLVALIVVAALMATGLLGPDEALAGFSNKAVVTIAALFIVGGAVLQTGLAAILGHRILAIAGGSELRLTVVIMVAVALLSSFMSNTGTVAVLLPAIISLGKSANISPSRLLIPLSFGSSLGGAMTLIGTPPNLIAHDLLKAETGTGFHFFSFLPIGLILLAGGCAYMLLFGRRLLPDRKPEAPDVQRVESPDELKEIYQLPKSLYRLRVRRGSDLIGMTIAEAKLRQEFNIVVIDIMRPMQPRQVMKIGGSALVLERRKRERIEHHAGTTFELDDILVVHADADDVQHVGARYNLGILPAKPEEKAELINDEVGIAEVLLPPRSEMVGKSLKEVRFGTRNKLTVLHIRRPGVEERLDLRDTPLEFGDTLLVQGTWKDILALRRKRRDFVVMGEPEAGIGAQHRDKAPLACIILVAMLLAMIFKVLPLTSVSLLAAIAFVITGCVTMDEAYDAMDWKSLFLIAGMIPMATALQKVGAIDLAADWLTSSLGGLGPSAVIGGLFLFTSLLTQVLSNTATTVLLAPVAYAAAMALNYSPVAFVMTVAVAASMAFASPVASPTNTLVMGAGNYTFSDYAKVGGPLIFVSLVLTVIFLPIFFPL